MKKEGKNGVLNACLLIALAIILITSFSISSKKDNSGISSAPSSQNPFPRENKQGALPNRRGRHLYDPQDTRGLVADKMVYAKFLKSAISIVKKTGNMQADSLIRYANQFSRISVPIDQLTIRSLEPVDTGAYFLPIIVTRKNDFTLPSYWLQYGQHEQAAGAFDNGVFALVIMPDASTSLVDQGMTIIHELQHAHSNYWQPYLYTDYPKRYDDERKSFELEFALYAAYGGKAYERAFNRQLVFQQRMLDSLHIEAGESIVFTKEYDYDLDEAFDKVTSAKDQTGRMTRLGVAATFALIDKSRLNTDYKKAFYIYGCYVALKIDVDGHKW